jgi:hypothetical protein
MPGDAAAASAAGGWRQRTGGPATNLAAGAERFRQALAVAPDDLITPYNLAQALLELDPDEHRDEADRLLLRVIETQPYGELALAWLIHVGMEAQPREAVAAAARMRIQAWGSRRRSKRRCGCMAGRPKRCTGCIVLAWPGGDGRSQAAPGLRWGQTGAIVHCLLCQTSRGRHCRDEPGSACSHPQ